VAGKDKVYDEVQEEIATLERSLEKELKKLEKQVGLVGLMFQPLFHLNFSPDTTSHTGTVTLGIRYRLTVQGCPDNNIDRSYGRIFTWSRQRSIRRRFQRIGSRAGVPRWGFCCINDTD